MHPYHKLLVWRRAKALATAVYDATEPWRDRAVAEQLRRAAASVPANIVEGAGSATQGRFARYLGFALSSAHETQFHLEFAHTVRILEQVDYERFNDEIVQVKKMLTALVRTVRENEAGRKLAAKSDAQRARAEARRNKVR